MPDEVPTLAIRDLDAGYGSIKVLHNVSVTVSKGQIITLIGANGAGKSTLMKAICGLVKPTCGKIVVDGTDRTGQATNALVRAGVGIVPEGRRLFGEMSLRENLEMGAYSRNDKRAVTQDFERVMTLFPELKDRLETIVRTFSGGQQQMVAIARALMAAPRLLLLDEPTIGLAPVIVDRVGTLISEISRMGVDILLIEQNAEVALSISDYGYVLENGRVTMADHSNVLLTSSEIQQAYLGV